MNLRFARLCKKFGLLLLLGNAPFPFFLWAQAGSEPAGPPAPPGQSPKGMHVYLWAGLKSHREGQHDSPQFLADWSKFLTQRGAAACTQV
jgi:hypothetical protein